MEPIKPDWFDAWFTKLFIRETYPPSMIYRKLNLKKDRIYLAIKTGEIDAFKTNGRWFVPKPALRKWLLDCYSLND